MVERWRKRVERAPERAWTLGLLAGVGALAALARLVALVWITPGFRVAEATNALMARQIGDDQFPIFFGRESDATEPFFPYLVRITGELLNWGVEGPRLAAALCGIGAAIATAFWLGRALGRPWGLAGGALVAFGFWPLMYSTQALTPMSGTLFAALGLWLAWVGLARAVAVRGPVARSRRIKPDYLWYAGAGAAFGLGFYTTTGYLVMPGIVLILALTLARRQQSVRPDLGVGGPGIMILSMTLVMMPLASFYLDNPDDFQRNLELAGGLPEQIHETRGPYQDTLESLVWRGTNDPARNLPGRALLDPILAVWSAIGLLATLRHPLRPLHSVVLSTLILGPLASGVLTSTDPGLLVPLAPLLLALPVIGMQAVYEIARSFRRGESSIRPPSSPVANEGEHEVRPYGGARFLNLRRWSVTALGLLIALSILASSAWSLYDYFWLWAGSEEAYLALRGDVRDAVEAMEDLPEDGLPVYVVTADAQRIVGYLAPERTRRDIESRSVLAMPEDEDAYLLYARSTEPDALLRAYLGEGEPDLVRVGEGPGGETSYWMWVLNPRVRDRLPYAVPAIPFANGWRLAGYEARTAPMLEDERVQIDVVQVWNAPVDADPHGAVARLRPVGDSSGARATSEQILVQTWKNNPLGSRELILTHLRLDFPRTADLTADLQAGLRDPATSRSVPPEASIQDGVFAFLNTIGLVPPE